jgi:FAD/FMN-containing dehydrogenase
VLAPEDLRAVDNRALKELAEIVGEEYLSTRKDVLLTYSASASTSYERRFPSAVIRPANTQQVSDILRVATKYRIRVTPRSGGSSLQGEVIPTESGLVVDLLRLDTIEVFSTLRAVKVGAGVSFGRLDKHLLEYGVWVPVYPGSSLSATLAGNVAVNGSGFGSSRFGCIAEMVQGLEVVLPDGTIINTGSEANPNAPGPFLRYAFGPDLTGLFIGSLGAFGIITSVSLKTFKRMHFFDYNTYGFDTAEQAEKFILELKENDVSSVWAAIYEGRILDFFLEMVGEEYDVPKHEWPPFTVSLVIGRVRQEQLICDIKAAREVAQDLGGHVIGIRELPQGEWNDRMLELARSSYVHGWHWRILYHHQTPSNWHKTLEVMWPLMDEFGVLGHTAGFQSDHASYNYYPQIYYDPQDSEDEAKAKAAHKELSKRLFRTGAVPFKLAPYWADGIEDMESYFGLVREIKLAVDPNGIMHPGVIPCIDEEK